MLGTFCKEFCDLFLLFSWRRILTIAVGYRPGSMGRRDREACFLRRQTRAVGDPQPRKAIYLPDVLHSRAHPAKPNVWQANGFILPAIAALQFSIATAD